MGRGYIMISIDGDVCEYCATEEIGSGYAEGAELIKLMGTGWDDD